MNSLVMFLVVLLVEVTVVFAVALLAVGKASGARASLRHLILATAFGVVLFLPVATLLSPRITFEFSAIPARAADSFATPAIAAPVNAEPRRPAAEPAARVAASGTPARSIPAATWLLVIWAAVALIALVPVGASLSQLRRIRRSARSWPEGATRTRELAHAAGIRPPLVLLHDGIAGPITSGLVRPVIALPSSALTWSPAHVANALVHELAHVRRRDWPVHLTSRTVCALYWFHPLAWIAWRMLRLEAERACDDAVLAREDAATYAEQLLELARHLAHKPAPGLSMASSSDLATRIRSILDNLRPRGRAGKVAIAITVLAAGVAVAVLAPLRATATAEKRMYRAAELLAQRTDADSLAAAGLLTAFEQREQGLGLVAQAALLSPERADLAWLHIQLCTAVASCDPEPLEARLRSLDARNGAGWLGALTRASKRGDEAASFAALAAVGRSGRMDVYWNSLVSRLSSPAANTGTLSLEEALISVIGVLAAQAIPGLREISGACKAERLRQDDVLEACRGVASSFLNGDTIITESIGADFVRRVWPENSVKWVEAVEAKRILKYRLRTVGASSKTWVQDNASEYLDLYKQHRREQDVMKAMLLAMGKNPDPAPAE